MATLTTSRRSIKVNRPRPARSIRLELPCYGKNSGVVSITVGRQEDKYFVTRVPSEIGGDAYRVEKIGEPASDYHVRLGAEGHSCECLGFLRHDRCKHVEGLAALKNAGRL